MSRSCEWCGGTHQKPDEEVVATEIRKPRWGKIRGQKVLKAPAKILHLCARCKKIVQRQLDEAAEVKARAAAER